MFVMQEKLYTVDEVAEHVKKHPISIRRAIRAGKLQTVRVGKSIRISESALEAWLHPEQQDRSKDE
jgi:excisionase family DNA binding protein